MHSDLLNIGIEAAVKAVPELATKRGAAEGTATGCLRNVLTESANPSRDREWRDLVHLIGRERAEKAWSEARLAIQHAEVSRG